MSVAVQRKVVRGPAKIIPFPVARSIIRKKQPRIAHWVYWLVLLLLASAGGEIWSSWVSSTAAVDKPRMEPKATPSAY